VLDGLIGLESLSMAVDRVASLINCDVVAPVFSLTQPGSVITREKMVITVKMANQPELFM